MLWRKKIEDAVYHFYDKCGLQGFPNQRDKLVMLCMNNLELFPNLKKELETDQQLEYFIIKTVLEYFEYNRRVFWSYDVR